MIFHSILEVKAMRYGRDGQTSGWQNNFVRTTGLKGWWPRALGLTGSGWAWWWWAADPPQGGGRRSNAEPCIWQTAPSRPREEAAGSRHSVKRCNAWGALAPGIGTDWAPRGEAADLHRRPWVSLGRGLGRGRPCPCRQPRPPGLQPGQHQALLGGKRARGKAREKQVKYFYFLCI